MYDWPIEITGLPINNNNVPIENINLPVENINLPIESNNLPIENNEKSNLSVFYYFFIGKILSVHAKDFIGILKPRYR